MQGRSKTYPKEVVINYQHGVVKRSPERYNQYFLRELQIVWKFDLFGEQI